jgi:hypothetical protein
LFRVVAEGGSDLSNAGVDTEVIIDMGIVAPKGVLNILTGNDLTTATHQELEELGGLRMELVCPVVFP